MESDTKKPDVTSPEVTMYNMYSGNMYDQGDQLFDVNTPTGHRCFQWSFVIFIDFELYGTFVFMPRYAGKM
jgi:hypothetical protein